MNKRERDEHISRNFWDSCAADRVMSVIRNGLRSDVWRDDLVEAHFHLVYHFAHDENARHDFHVRHGIKSVLHLQKLVTQSETCHA